MVHVGLIWNIISTTINARHEKPKFTRAVYTLDNTKVRLGSFVFSIRPLLSFSAVMAVRVAVPKNVTTIYPVK